MANDESNIASRFSGTYGIVSFRGEQLLRWSPAEKQELHGHRGETRREDDDASRQGPLEHGSCRICDQIKLCLHSLMGSGAVSPWLGRAAPSG